MLFLWLLVFTISLITLLKAADYFTDYAERLGHILGMSLFTIGVVIVAIGTSLPEWATSLMSVAAGKNEMVSGNVIGTVAANILLGLGLVVLLARRSIKLKRDVFKGDLPVFIGGMILVAFTMMDGELSFLEAMLFIAGYFIYVIFTKRTYYRELDKNGVNTKKKWKEIRESFGLIWRIPFILILSLIGIFISSYFVVNSVIHIATLVGLGASVLAATLIAAGTSLPEIAVAYAALRKNKFDLIIGDIIGSNIFDIFIIFGTCGLISKLIIPSEIISLVIPLTVAVSVFFWLILTDKKITRTEGALMVLIYILFVGKLFKLF